MKHSIALLIGLIFLIACNKESPNRNLRILDISVDRFTDANQGIKWDSLDGPDLFISISINDSIVFVSNKLENIDVINTPVYFTLNSPIACIQGKDIVTLNLFDNDGSSDQILLENFDISLPYDIQSRFALGLSCGACVVDLAITYEVVN